MIVCRLPRSYPLSYLEVLISARFDINKAAENGMCILCTET